VTRTRPNVRFGPKSSSSAPVALIEEPSGPPGLATFGSVKYPRITRYKRPWRVDAEGGDTGNRIPFRVGSRSAPIGTPVSGVLADDFSDLRLFWPGSRFGADSQVCVTMSAGSRKQEGLSVVQLRLKIVVLGLDV
jgi:hypothetical protein